MTQEYEFIRREVYELKVSGGYLKRRTFKDMRQLFKPLYWILFSFIMISIIVLLVVLISFCISKINAFWAFIPALIICASLLIIDSISEKYLYKKEARKQEITQEKALQTKYLQDVRAIFESEHLNDNAIDLIKSECEDRINKVKTKGGVFQNKIIDIMIIAPIAAIMTLLVDANKHLNINAIVVLLLLGLIILGLIKVLLPIQGIWNNTHKDQCLLDTIYELEYFKHSDTKEQGYKND